MTQTPMPAPHGELRPVRVLELSFVSTGADGSRREWSLRVAPWAAIATVGLLALLHLSNTMGRLPSPNSPVASADPRRTEMLAALTTIATSPGLAPGAPVGSSADIITPLNVRDPSALVMAPGR